MRVHISYRSNNAKTGPIPVTTTSADTCPPSCPFNDGSCYAKSGPLAIHWKAVSSGQRGLDWQAFLRELASFPMGLWRMNQAGDLPGDGDSLDVEKLAQLVKANNGRKGFTYTHKPLATQKERDAVQQANANGFTINLSGNSPSHADTLADLAIAPVTTVLPHDMLENTTTPKGRRIVICPAVTRDNVSCATCGLCQIADRGCIVGFPAHGIAKRKASAIASTA
jgi:hypothetical protein